MKPNRFKQAVSEGRIPIGHMLGEFTTSGMAQMLEGAGVDFAMIDMEHGAYSLAQVADMVAWFKATTVAPFVRVPGSQYHFIARALDAGVLGVMVPNVKSGGEARSVVEAAKYPPMGKRGFSTGAISTDYGDPDAAEWVERANADTTVIIMIESPEGLENLKEIASTPGVDVLWVGFADMCQYMGIPGQYHDPRFLDGMKKVIDAAKKHGLRSAIQPSNPEQLKEWVAMGFDVISYGRDTHIYKEALARAVADVRRITQE